MLRLFREERERETERDWETRKWVTEKETNSHDINYWWCDVKQISASRSRECRSSTWAQRANPQSMWNVQRISVFRGLMFKSLLSGIRAWLSRKKKNMFLLHTSTECSLDPCQNHRESNTCRRNQKHFMERNLHFRSSQLSPLMLVKVLAQYLADMNKWPCFFLLQIF